MEEWLEQTVELPEYYSIFQRQGINCMDTVKLLTNEDLKNMKIEKIGDFRRLSHFINKLKEQNIKLKDNKEHDTLFEIRSINNVNPMMQSWIIPTWLINILVLVVDIILYHVIIDY